MNRTIQQAARKLHLWSGLAAGAFLAMMGLTGMIIVYRPVLEDAAAPRPQSGNVSAGMAAVEQSFAGSYPAARITAVTVPQTPPGLLLIQAETADRRRLAIYFAAASGKELGPKKKIAWLDWTADLHQNLLLGKSGRALTGIIGVALAFMALSGIVSWWAGASGWRRGLALPRKGPWRRTNYELHRWAGLWANALLLIVSLTGIVLAYPDSFEQAARSAFGEPPPVKVRIPAADRPRAGHVLPLDAYVQAAEAAVPGGVVREVHMPSRTRPTVSILLWTREDIRPKGENLVLLSPDSARVLAVERSADAPLSSKLVALANAIHKTELGGMPVKLFWSLLGLVPAVLFLSGMQIWWSRRSASRLADNRKAAIPPAPAEELAGRDRR